LMVDRESTRHYWRTLGEFGKSREIHPPLADLYHLLLALDLAVRVGCLPLERSSGLRAIFHEMGRAAAIETTIVVVSLVGWRKVRPWALLLLLLGLWCRWLIESSPLGWPSYPSAWYIVLRWDSGSSVPTNRYLGGCAVEGPVGVFRFFSARWAEIQSSRVMAILTNSLKLSAFTKFNRSLSLVFRPRRKRSCLRASVSTCVRPGATGLGTLRSLRD
jgi:hypothetical protein